MGRSHSIEEQSLFQWVKIDSNHYVHKQTGQIISYQQIVLHSQEQVNQYHRRMQMRKSHIIQLLYYRNSHMNDTNRGDIKLLDVFIEGDIYKLQRVKQRNKKCTRKCYCKEIIKGFQNLKQCYGTLEVQIGMVWINRENNVKVWLNCNPFYNNYKQTSQSLMVLQIKGIILQLECQCGMFKDEMINFSNLKNPSKLVDPSLYQNTFFPASQIPNRVFPHMSTPISHQPSVKNIFLYPVTVIHHSERQSTRPGSCCTTSTNANKSQTVSQSSPRVFIRNKSANDKTMEISPVRTSQQYRPQFQMMVQQSPSHGYHVNFSNNPNPRYRCPEPTTPVHLSSEQSQRCLSEEQKMNTSFLNQSSIKRMRNMGEFDENYLTMYEQEMYKRKMNDYSSDRFNTSQYSDTRLDSQQKRVLPVLSLNQLASLATQNSQRIQNQSLVQSTLVHQGSNSTKIEEGEERKGKDSFQESCFIYQREDKRYMDGEGMRNRSFGRRGGGESGEKKKSWRGEEIGEGEKSGFIYEIPERTKKVIKKYLPEKFENLELNENELTNLSSKKTKILLKNGYTPISFNQRPKLPKNSKTASQFIHPKLLSEQRVKTQRETNQQQQTLLSKRVNHKQSQKKIGVSTQPVRPFFKHYQKQQLRKQMQLIFSTEISQGKNEKQKNNNIKMKDQFSTLIHQATKILERE